MPENRQTAKPGNPVLIHIADFNDDVTVSVVIAECGVTAVILPDASVQPADFDFVGPEWPDNATCDQCKRKVETKTTKTQKVETKENQ
jgi:hypothetical protein